MADYRHCWSLRETIEELEHIASENYADEWETGLVWVDVDKGKRTLAFERCTDEALAQTHYEIGKNDDYDAGYDMCADDKVTPWLDDLESLVSESDSLLAGQVLGAIQALRDML